MVLLKSYLTELLLLNETGDNVYGKQKRNNDKGQNDEMLQSYFYDFGCIFSWEIFCFKL